MADESEFNVGDTIRHDCGGDQGTILAVGHEWLYVKYSNGQNEGWRTEHCYKITRIEPDVPQAKFCVGQSVQRPYSRIPGVVVAIRPDTRHYYDVRWSDGVSPGVSEAELEAVPACPMCGKVGDG